MWESLILGIEEKLDFKFNVNQTKNITRLLYEISKQEKNSIEDIVNDICKQCKDSDTQGKSIYFVVRKMLIKKRFPLTIALEKIDPNKIFLSSIKTDLKDNIKPQASGFVPEKIFVEQGAQDSYLLKRLKDAFPKTAIENITRCRDFLKKNKFSLKDLKAPYIFIVQEKWDFIKKCPCTKEHLSCNYWIFNLGFGCPYDCSYCFLQHYSNFCGITLPANLDDFFIKFDNFFKKINKTIRIGTGEFCDSLALDHITNYSSQLINFFRDKDVLFELKTKSDNIDNLLNLESSKNIVISWSLNPQEIIDKEEIATASLEQRLKAAKKIQEKGYSLSFHFDPIIICENWEEKYKEVISLIYSRLRPPFKWISLGTLRGSKELKIASEQRFPKSKIFYGELLIGEDKKLRYHKVLRKKVYENMLKWIKEFDQATPVYLCMEDKQMWQTIDKNIKTAKEVEEYLIRSKKIC